MKRPHASGRWSLGMRPREPEAEAAARTSGSLRWRAIVPRQNCRADYSAPARLTSGVPFVGCHGPKPGMVSGRLKSQPFSTSPG